MKASDTSSIVQHFKSYLLDRSPVFTIHPDEEIDETSILHDLKKENLDHLFYLKLKDTSSEVLSVPFRKSLDQTYRLENGIRLLQLHEISKIIFAFKNIPLLFMKGALLGHWLGCDLYKRSCDIDILIEKKSIEEAVSVLVQLGYEIIPTKSHGEFSMKNKQGIFIDVHYDLSVSSPLFYLVNLNISDLLANQKVLVTIQGYQIPTFNKEVTFIHLCIHFMVNHHFNDFILLYELITFLNTHSVGIDWDFIYDYTHKHKLNAIMELTLSVISTQHPSIIRKDILLRFIPEKRSRLNAQTFIEKHAILKNLSNGQKNNIGHNTIALYCTNNVNKIFPLIRGYFKRVLKQTS